jgi:hypothetical protein
MAAGSAAAATPRAHGQLIEVRANTNQSSNWFGYNQGSLEQGGKLFTSITGDWTVPTVSGHTAEPSAPDPDGDGFKACTWATSCAAPSSS